MKSAEHAIERNVKLIAGVGAVLCLTLGGALVIVQQNLGATQSELADVVVPTQGALEDLSGSVGALFLRESEIVGADAAALPALADRSGPVRAVEAAEAQLRALATRPTLAHVEGFGAAVSDLDASVAAFSAADAELFPAVSKHRALAARFEQNVAAIDADLRQVVQASGGLAGVLRLEYVAMLRRVAAEIGGGSVRAELVRPAILGDSRAQLAAIDRLDAAVLRLGMLAGRVGLAQSTDALNSLAANELVQNRGEISQELATIARLVGDDAVADRVAALRETAEALAARVGDEERPDSLASLRRQMLAETARVGEIQRTAAGDAGRVSAAAALVRDAAAQAARNAQDDAEATIATSRLVTLVIAVIGLVLAFIAGIRVRSSVFALRAQNAKLTKLSDDLARTNEGLEDTVRKRTAALQLVLDSTGDGMLAVGLDGEILPERSRAVVDWFGDPASDERLWGYLAPADPTLRDSLWLGYEQLASNIFPFEVAAEQAPALLARDGRTYALSYREVSDGGELDRVLVLVRDITAQLDAERAEREARELHVLIGNILRDREGFRQTVAECTALIELARRSEEPLVVRRALHTIKGNSGIMGFVRLADEVHELESRMADEERSPTAEELDAIDAIWHESLAGIEDYLGSSERRVIQIDEDEVCELLDVARRSGAYAEILPIVEHWCDEPVAVPLERLATQARHLAKRLGKEVDVVVDGGHVRVAPEPLKELWSTMVHVVRNALDHGIDTADERRDAGKSAAGRLELTARQLGDTLEIAIADDGRGIDWESVRERAIARGLPHAAHEHLVDALFADGLTTMRVATALSGRGVGLGAVRAACRSVGGSVTAESEPGRGTRFVIRVPWQLVAHAVPAHAA
ncbi:MAG: Hpt domain-containing protein [Myxococcales bacterium]|nr:Hpt domain-containing protein [Myxococcales bacterium]MCB9735322.1 Hpt domain-containing protein [Deltaproteobacteria bacterium]